MTNELSPANQHAGDIAPKALAFLGMARVIAESTMNAGTARAIPMAWRSRQFPCLPASWRSRMPSCARRMISSASPGGLPMRKPQHDRQPRQAAKPASPPANFRRGHDWPADIVLCGRYAINIDCPLEQHRIEKGKFLMDTIRNPIDFNGLALPMDNLG